MKEKTTTNAEQKEMAAVERINVTEGVEAEPLEKKKPIVMVLFLTVIIYFASITIGSIVVVMAFATSVEENQSNFLTLTSALQILLFGVPMYFILKRKGFMDFKFKISGKEVLLTVVAVALGLTLGDLTTLTAYVLDLKGSFSLETMVAQNTVGAGGNIILQIGGIALAAAIVEEILCRSVLFGTIRSRKGFWFSAILSSLIFAALHGVNMIMIFAFLLGLLYCYIYEVTGNIFITMLAHFCNNLISVLFMNLIGDGTANLTEDITMISSITGETLALIITGLLAIGLLYITIKVGRKVKAQKS